MLTTCRDLAFLLKFLLQLLFHRELWTSPAWLVYSPAGGWSMEEHPVVVPSLLSPGVTLNFLGLYGKPSAAGEVGPAPPKVPGGYSPDVWGKAKPDPPSGPSLGLTCAERGDGEALGRGRLLPGRSLERKGNPCSIFERNVAEAFSCILLTAAARALRQHGEGLAALGVGNVSSQKPDSRFPSDKISKD